MPTDPGEDETPPQGFRWVAERAVVTIQEERGRWVVFVRTEGWAGDDGPFEVLEARIEDYPTRRAAEIAAQWIQRTANKSLKRPNFGN